MNPKRIPYLLPILYFILFFGIYHLLFVAGVIKSSFISENLLNRDAVWYQSIMLNGYQYKEWEQSNPAFFPLLPYMWRLTSASAFGISLVNLMIFIGGAFLFIRNWTKDSIVILALLSTPTLLFVFLPYTEALFFVSGILLLLGFKRKSLWLVISGATVAGLCRSILVFYVPISFLLLYMYWADKELRKCAFGFLTASIGSFAIVMVFQYMQTNVPFAFFKAQHHWGNSISIPELPLYSWRRETLWEDIIGLTIGFGSALVLLKTLWFRKINAVPADVFISLCYITGASLFVFLFRSGNLASLNRYVMCSPFFWILAINLTTLQFRFRKKIWWVVLFLTCMLANLGLYQDDPNVSKFFLYLGAIALLFCRWFYWTVPERKWFAILIIIMGFAFQIHLLHHFLSGQGVG